MINNDRSNIDTTAEISMYPLRGDYIPAIDAMIEKLNSYPNVRVETFATATTLTGTLSDIMDAIEDAIGWSYDNYGNAVFAVKIIPGYSPGS